MPAPMVNSAPGWYPDPNGGEGQRWWNGSGWTDQVRAATAPEDAFAADRRRQRTVAIVAGVVAVVIVLIVVIAFRPSSKGPDTETSSTAPPLGAVINGVSSTTATPTTVDKARTFTDPAGVYSIQTSPDWLRMDVINGIAQWSVAPPTEQGVTPNVNVVVENMTRNGATLDDYTVAALDAMERNGLKIQSNDTVTLPDGNLANVIVYDNTVSGVRVRQEAMFLVRGSRAIIVTTTATPDTADEVFAAVDPYITTVRFL